MPREPRSGCGSYGLTSFVSPLNLVIFDLPFVTAVKQPPFLVPESALLRKLDNRDELAFQWLYDQYSHVIYGVILTALRSPQQTAQLTEDVFVSAWQDFDQFNPRKSRLLSWLLMRTRLAVGEALAHARQEAPQPRPLADHSIPTNLISEEQRILLEAIYFQGQSISNIALVSQESESNLRTHLRSILQKLTFVFSQ